MFDALVLQVVRKGYSAQDEPGERYDVYVIDYGAYVDLIHTKFEPLGTLRLAERDEGDERDDRDYVEAPTQALRAIRRSILDLAEFSQATDGEPA